MVEVYVAAGSNIEPERHLRHALEALEDSDDVQDVFANGDIPDDVLARPEYRPLEPGVVERVLGWLSEQLGRLIELIASGGAGGVAGSWDEITAPL